MVGKKNGKGSGSVRGMFVGRWIQGYGRYTQFKQYLKTVSSDGIIKQRLEIIKFFTQYGSAATKAAYGYSKSSVYAWRKKYIDSKYNPRALHYGCKRPKRVRRMSVDSRIITFIKTVREHNVRCGKTKIKKLLDMYCNEHSLRTISESLIGKIITRNNYFFAGKGIPTHDPNRKKRATSPKQRIQKGYQAEKPGSCIQIDTVVRFDHGVKRYILTAIDLYSRFSFAYAYSRLSSEAALDFYLKLETIAPFSIKAVKTDNGLEFHGHFDDNLQKQHIIHYFSYPRTPKSNAFIERFNRTIQEECIDEAWDIYTNLNQFNERIIDYLLYYNTVRPHHALQLQTPLGVITKELLLSNMSVTSTNNSYIPKNMV